MMYGSQTARDKLGSQKGVLDVVIVRLQVGIAEAGIYPLLIIGSEFGHDVDFGLADIAHILGSPSVMSLA